MLEHLDAHQSLSLGRLVVLDRKMNVLNGRSDSLGSEPSLGGRVHALLNYDLDNVRKNRRKVHLPLLVGYLQLSPF